MKNLTDIKKELQKLYNMDAECGVGDEVSELEKTIKGIAKKLANKEYPYRYFSPGNVTEEEDNLTEIEQYAFVRGFEVLLNIVKDGNE